MIVTSPRYYLKLVSHDDVSIPLWLSERSTAITIPDLWEERRLPGFEFSSIFHATLPAAFIKYPSDSHTLTVQEPVWWSDTLGPVDPSLPLSSTRVTRLRRFSREIIHGEPCLVAYRFQYFPKYFTDATHSRVRILGRETQAFKPGNVTSSAFAWASYFRLTCNSSTVWDEANPPNMSPNDIWSTYKTQLESLDFNQWEEAATLSGSVSEAETNWDKEALQKWCEAQIQSALRYAERTNVLRHAHQEPTRDILGRKTGLFTFEEDRGMPMWFEQNLDVQTGKARAYIDALEDLSTLSMNTLQNLAALYSLAAHFLFDADATTNAVDELIKQAGGKRYMNQQYALDLPAIPAYSKNAWLGGRYIWSTSVSDAHQGFDYVMRKIWQQMKVVSDSSKCHGQATVGDTAFSCTFVCKERALQGLSKAIAKSYELGIEPNAYVLWDFVPYSFVIDWFVPIGDTLDAYTKASHYCPLYYEYLPHYGGYSMCYSLKYTARSAIGPIEVYHRWYEHDPPEVDTSYFVLDKHSASSKIECWRFVDALCLVLPNK